MKFRALISLLAAFAVFNAFGIGATQEWVRRMLSQYQPLRSSGNITVTGGFNASVMGADCAEATCTISTEIGTHVALKVIASNVSEVPAGSFYAMNPDGHFVNARNAYLSTIYAAPYNSGSVRMANLWAVDSTGKAWRMGIGEDTFIYRTDDPSKRITLRSTKIPARGVNSILTAMARGFVAPWLLYADEDGELEYTIRSETTIAIGQITFTRKDKNGKVTTVTFTPEDLTGVYKGPNGPFKTKEEARAAAMDLDNWDFGDWIKKFNTDMTSAMTKKDLQNSDAWKFLIDAIESERVEVEIENPQPYQHPCPAPADYWDWSATAKDWVVNPVYDTAEELDKWRGSHGCLCGFEGCENAGKPKHRVGRVTKKGGETHFTDDADGGDGCKCCIRCVLYGADESATIIEFNDHRAAGVDAGSCGCACEMYTVANEDEWPRDFHNRPVRMGGKDYACLCYCGKEKALNGQFVQHVKYKGDDPWCEKICSACEMVEDEEKYIAHSWPAFDTRHVTLRAHEWSDHTPRSEAKGGVSVLNDPTFYDRCGCACGAYDEIKSGGLPQEFAAFHQQKADSCRCHCGQNHTKNTRGENKVEPFQCPEICAVCLMVEDKESDAVFTFNGEQYKKLVMRTPTEETDHTKHGILCGCKCYNEVTARHEWSIGGAVKDSIEADGSMPEFHVMNAAGCGCECGGVKLKTLSPKYHHGPNKLLGSCWCDCGGFHIGYLQKTQCRVCDNCGKTEGGDIPNDESLHKLKEGAKNEAGDFICRCDCGYYSSDGVYTSTDGGTNAVWEAVARIPSAGGKLHDFDRSDSSKNEIGSLPCLCYCGGKHEARMATTYQKNNYGRQICEDVCTYCKERTKDGKAATELDHEPIPASEKHCGCKCGYYGISDGHEASGRAAQSAHLHIQSKGNAEGVAYCQCFGNGSGGKHHWHHPKPSDTCPKICQHKRTGTDLLGHLATEDGHEIGFKEATGADHTAKEHGCGCKCGLCGKDTASFWANDLTLHHPAQNAADRCHCECEKKKLVGSGEGGHEWPPMAAVNACTCTCGEKHKDDYVNACGYCSVCGYIWRNGVRLDAKNKNNHLWENGGCYCDGGCVIDGGKILHPDGHRYMKNKCVCLCGEEKREHILVEQKERAGDWVCWECNAMFLNFRVTTVCSRCEAEISTHVGTVGEHNPGCGEPKPSCWKCGCHCSNYGPHGECNVHYCSTCCTKKPAKPSRPLAPDPDDPDSDPDEPEPEPPEPFITCKHPNIERLTWDHWLRCESCHEDIHFWGEAKVCLDCGMRLEYNPYQFGEHGAPCNGKPVEQDVVCQELTTGNGVCGLTYKPSEGCPGAAYHKNTHTNNGGTGGNGKLDDI